MRDFFIRALEVLIGVFAIIAILGVVGASVAIALTGDPASFNGTNPMLVAAGALVGGLLYVIFVFGFLYLGIGIYQNTRRTADALER